MVIQLLSGIFLVIGDLPHGDQCPSSEEEDTQNRLILLALNVGKMRKCEPNQFLFFKLS